MVAGVEDPNPDTTIPEHSAISLGREIRHL